MEDAREWAYSSAPAACSASRAASRKNPAAAIEAPGPIGPAARAGGLVRGRGAARRSRRPGSAPR